MRTLPRAFTTLLRRWSWSLSIVVVGVVSFYLTEAWAQPPPKTFKDLRLEIGQLRDQKSCVGDGEIYSEFLKFDIRYVNTSNVSYDLFLNGDGPIETMVARTLGDLRIRKLEADWSPYIIPPLHDSNERTVHLAPGGAAESRLPVGLFVSVGARVPGTLTAGSYFVQVRIQVGASKSPIARVKQTSKPAKPKSVLIESNAIRVEVPANPNLAECSPN